MLKRLYVDNYRSLVNFEMAPGRVSALVGPNGSGKSSVLTLLNSLRSILVAGDDISTHFPAWSRTRWDQRPTQRVEIDVEADGLPMSYMLLVEHEPDGNRPRIKQERLESNGQLLYEIVEGQVRLYPDVPSVEPCTAFPSISTRSFLPLLETRKDNRRIQSFKQWLSGVWLFSLQPFGINFASEEEARYLSITGDNFVAYYRMLSQEHPEVIGKVLADLQPVIPGLVTLRLIPIGPTSKALTIDCEQGGAKFGLSTHELSEGQKALLILYTILHALPGRVSLLAFDEPDNFITQSEIQPWLSALREAILDSGPSTLLMISHHPEVIDYLAADHAIYFWRDSDGLTRTRDAEVDREKGLSLSEWLKMGAPNGLRG